VGDDPYAAKEKPTDNMMQKLWADPRLHGKQKKIGSNEDGSAIFAGARPTSHRPFRCQQRALECPWLGRCIRVKVTSARHSGRRDGGSSAYVVV
jgi:hypothetical protein